MQLECRKSCNTCNCVDSEADCEFWAKQSECTKNPTFMLERCPKACGNCDGSKLPAQQQQQEQPAALEDWELENLEVAYPDSVVMDVDEQGLRELAETSAQEGKVVIAWFYAPWCKQCKLARPAFESVARASAEHMPSLVFAKVDCVRHAGAKKAFGVSAYPAFKALRGAHSHRWIEIPRKRTEESLTAAFERELAGPVQWLGSEAALRTALFEQVAEGTHEMDAIGQGEALALALLPDGPTSDLARQYTRMAANCSARSSPLPFAALMDPALASAVGLPALQPNTLAIVKLFSEPADAPDSERTAPRTVVAPLTVVRGSSGGSEASAAEEEVAATALCTWALGSRLPLLIDFQESPVWGKRAAGLGFVHMHALLFLTPPHAHLAGTVRAAAARFETGQVLTMKFMLEGMDVGENAMFKRYGVHSALDTPRLVFLDQRIAIDGAGAGGAASRQKLYKESAITEEGVVSFLLAEGLRLADATANADAPKDEL